jgi:shikimate dehydrogenase
MKFGLLGRDISYSQSPTIFRLIKEHSGIELSYDLFDIEKDEIKNYIQHLKEGTLDGLQVTKPYKEVVMEYCDELTETAKKIGSVNTIYLRHQKVIGDNTDAYGFLQLLNLSSINLNHQHVCIFGNGGAAKAVYHVCQNQHVIPTIFKRSNSLKEMISPIEFNYENDAILTCDIIIQATSYDFDEAFITNLKNRGCQPEVVIDLMYHQKTHVMSLGKHVFDGKLMLMYQAIRSFELFLNQKIKDVDKLVDQMKGVL